MKKIIALSLTFALAGAMGGAINIASHHNENCSECNVSALQFSEINKDFLIGEGFAVLHQNGKFNVVPKKPANLVIDNGNAQINNNEVLSNQNQTNNLNTNSTGTSTYGIRNANNSVLNNANNNSVLPRQNNIDSMVRTNNIDTYKNRTNPNFNGVYDNNGNKMANNTGINANYASQTNNTQSTPSSTSLTNKTIQQTTPMPQQNTIQNQNNSTKTLTTNNTQSSNTTKVTNIENKAKANITNGQSSTIDSLQNQLTEQKDRFNAKIQNINNILNNFENKTISLDGEQAIKMNGYLDVIEKLSHKLMQTHSFVTFDIENFWNASKFNATDEQSPYYLEIKSQLGTRIICFDCLNEALDNVTRILEDYSSTTKTQNLNSTTSSITTEQSKNEITA